MELNVPIDVLRKRKLFVATPAYGGQVMAVYAKSISDLTAMCTHYGIEMKLHLLMNESLIQRARNYCVDSFLLSDSTHLLFLDADIGFDANDVITMLALSDHEDPENQYDILGLPYAKKTLSEEAIVAAVNKGLVDDDPTKINDFVGDFVLNFLPGTTEVPLTEPCQVLELGTGTMLVKRHVFDKYREAHPEKMYKPDHVRTEQFDGSREICAYFDCVIDPETKRYLSEDYYFAQEIRKLGMKAWVLPWCKTIHYGTYGFGQGGLAAKAQLGISPTCEIGLLKKKSTTN